MMTNKGKMIEVIYSSDLTQRATLVIFYLINRANKENTCFPSVKTIAKECNISTRTVQRALGDLEEAGFLIRESRFHIQGGCKSNLYILFSVENEESQNMSTEDFDNPISVENDEDVIKAEKDIKDSDSQIKSIDFSFYSAIERSKTHVSGRPCHKGVP
jgi:predicted transcriptional regulator